MTTILTIIFALFIAFYVFMVTPFGAFWTMANMDEGKPCYGIIIMFVSIIPVMIIGSILGIID